MNLVDYSNIIIFICILVITSYLFNIISKWSKVPSVILLLLTGIVTKASGIEIPKVDTLLKILGTVGLIMIVLEGTLDLKLSKKKLGLINRSFLSALVVLLLSNVLITFIIVLWLPDASWHTALVYAIPMSVISSAIVIPSIDSLSEEKKEFTVYESTFSDILGIILFNFIASAELMNDTQSYTINFGIGIIGMTILCIILSFGLIYLIGKIKAHAKFFLIYSILIVLYTIGKIYHLPSLLMILIFGLIFNNLHLMTKGRFEKYHDEERFNRTKQELHHITAESSFLIRTFFFIIFGYSMDLSQLVDFEVIIVGSTIVMALILVRYFYLRFLLNSSILPELFLIPRGLITIILFYSIDPVTFNLMGFNEGVMSFVILATSILMMVGLILNRNDDGLEAVMNEDMYLDGSLVMGATPNEIPEDENGIHELGEDDEISNPGEPE